MRGKFSWPQAHKRWQGRLFSIKLPINDGLECFFAQTSESKAPFDYSSPLCPPVELASIWGSYGRGEARAPGLPFANA